MAKRPPFNFKQVHEFLLSLYAEDMHAKRVLSLANATLGVMTSASLAVHAIGQGLADARGLLNKHAVKQVDRLLSNRGIEGWEHFAQWVPWVVGEREEILVALDWTDFDHDGHTCLALHLVSAHGRATPLIWKTVEKATLKGRRASYEDEVLRRFREVVPEATRVTVLADRGFFDHRLLELLDGELDFGYVLRFKGNVLVTTAGGECRPAAQWVGARGRAKVLREATITAEHYSVGSIVCVQAKAMKEPWCLVASDVAAAPKELINHYARRWGIETSFRDIKDARFGRGLYQTRISSTERRDRLLLLAAFALALLTLLGAASEALGYDRWLKANTSKKRTHSLLRQGQMLYDAIANMSEQRLRPLMEKFAELVLAQRVFNQVFGFL